MAKIPFDIKFRPQIESGEYKVYCKSGNRPVRIICWDSKYKEWPIIGLMPESFIYDSGQESFLYCHETGKSSFGEDYDLFIITPEPELSEFEDGLRLVCEEAVKEAAVFPDRTSEVFAKTHSSELLALAREQFIKDGYVIEKKAFHDAVENIDDKHQAEMRVQYSLHCKIQDGTRNAVMNWSEFQKLAQKFIDIGKAEALRIHAKELTENLAKSGMDKDSIPYHLIEFMCNLYTCQNWKEIEATAELYVTRTKAAAMKDLPRWSPNDIYPELNDVVIGSIGTDDHFFIHKGRIIHLESLEKLPGFNE